MGLQLWSRNASDSSGGYKYDRGTAGSKELELSAEDVAANVFYIVYVVGDLITEDLLTAAASESQC